MSKRIFISDIHMGAQRQPLGARSPYDWLNEDEGNTLLGFLQYLHANETNLSELVIVGDFLDTWVCPHDEPPPTFVEILAAHPHIINAMNALLTRGVRLVFLEGNHDMYLTRSELVTVFPPSADLAFYPDFYLRDGVYAIHGHSFDSFNNRPAGTTPNISGYPLGYFITRIVATKKALTNSSKRPIVEVIEHFIHNVLHNTGSALAVFDAILEDVGLDVNTTFLMPHGTLVTVSEIKSAFADVHVSTSIADLRPFAEELARTHQASNGFQDVGLVVCGHTHGALTVELDLVDGGDDDFAYTQVYANSGTWIGSAENLVITPTYIEVEPDESDDQLIRVRRMNWKNGGPEERETKFFTLPGGNVIFTSPSP